MSYLTSKDVLSGIFVSDLFDHIPIFASIGYPKFQGEKKETFTYAPLTETAVSKTERSLAVIDWSFLDNLPVEEAYKSFHNIMQQTIDNCAPMKTVKNIPKEVNMKNG